jgi:hypothetical protein
LALNPHPMTWVSRRASITARMFLLQNFTSKLPSCFYSVNWKWLKFWRVFFDGDGSSSSQVLWRYVMLMVDLEDLVFWKWLGKF